MMSVIEPMLDWLTIVAAVGAVASGVDAIAVTSEARELCPDHSSPKRHIVLVRLSTAGALGHLALMIYWWSIDSVGVIGVVPTLAFQSWHMLGASAVGGMFVHHIIGQNMREFIKDCQNDERRVAIQGDGVFGSGRRDGTGTR